MSDKSSIDIDCDMGVVSSQRDGFLMWEINGGREKRFGNPEETRSSLIMELLIPQIRELMKLSKDELMKRHLELLFK